MLLEGNMTSEPEYNAHVKCIWCQQKVPLQSTINFDGYDVCKDGDCLPNIRRATDVAYVYLGSNAVGRNGGGK